LTETGAQHLEAAHVAVMGVETIMVQGFSIAQRTELGRLLARCASNLEAQ
jgi:hypothetical protein